MRKVRFNFPEIRKYYDKERLVNKIQDVFVNRFIKILEKKYSSDEVVQYVQILFDHILNKPYGLRALKEIEAPYKKFLFLPYEDTSDYKMLHEAAYDILALYNGSLLAIERYINSVAPHSVLLQVQYSNYGSHVGLSNIEPIREDISNIIEEYISNLLCEITTKGTIYSTEELEQEITDSYSDDEFEEYCSEEVDDESIKTQGNDRISEGHTNHRSINFECEQYYDHNIYSNHNTVNTKENSQSTLNDVVSALEHWFNELPKEVQILFPFIKTALKESKLLSKEPDNTVPYLITAVNDEDNDSDETENTQNVLSKLVSILGDMITKNLVDTSFILSDISYIPFSIIYLPISTSFAKDPLDLQIGDIYNYYQDCIF